MKKFICALVIGLSSASLLSGCATAMYTAPTKVSSAQDTYTFTIETNIYAGAGSADQRATEEINKFMTQNGYSSYKILNRNFDVMAGGYKYTVQFSK